jgi:hypothetical protein
MGLNWMYFYQKIRTKTILFKFQYIITIKSDSFKDDSQISNMETIFSKHSSALDLTNGSLSCLRVLKTAVGKSIFNKS